MLRPGITKTFQLKKEFLFKYSSLGNNVQMSHTFAAKTSKELIKIVKFLYLWQMPLIKCPEYAGLLYPGLTLL